MKILVVFHHIENARQSLRTNRMRSFLTTLGVTIGVASITAILSLGSGAGSLIQTQVDALGGGIAVIRPQSNTQSPFTKMVEQSSERSFATSTLNEHDLVYLRSIDAIDKIAPLIFITGTIRGNADTSLQASIVASTPELAEISQLPVQEGQFLSDSVLQETAVIGPQLAVDIFGTETPIGKQVSVRGKVFTIIGALKRQNNPITYNLVDFDNTLIINLASAKKLIGNTQIQQINIRAKSIDRLTEATVEINKTLLASHEGEQDFTVLSGDGISQPTSDLYDAIAGATTAIAGISLLVGGIGVMNILLVSVAERTREIGIRKALGASNGDIASQFIIESLAISIGGGIAGYVCGYLIAFSMSRFLSFNPVFTWEIASMAIGVSLVIGLIFGLYPAIRAARKDPIESLRQYE